MLVSSLNADQVVKSAGHLAIWASGRLGVWESRLLGVWCLVFGSPLIVACSADDLGDRAHCAHPVS